uniref:Uncharacterized protein n=1 Tax=Arundo donax TaxID=35708 RepID=A0A0A9BFV2_ARUDO
MKQSRIHTHDMQNKIIVFLHVKVKDTHDKVADASLHT